MLYWTTIRLFTLVTCFMWQKSTTHTYKQNHIRFPFCTKLPDLISYLGKSVSYANDSAHNQMVNCVAHVIWPVYICLLALEFITFLPYVSLSFSFFCSLFHSSFVVFIFVFILWAHKWTRLVYCARVLFANDKTAI